MTSEVTVLDHQLALLLRTYDEHISWWGVCGKATYPHRCGWDVKRGGKSWGANANFNDTPPVT